MRPDEQELDDEIRGHLAIEIQERIDRGEDPEQARLGAMRQFGYLPKMRDRCGACVTRAGAADLAPRPGDVVDATARTDGDIAGHSHRGAGSGS